MPVVRAAIVVFSVPDNDSLSVVEELCERLILRRGDLTPIVYIVGNQIDRIGDPGAADPESIGADFYATSAQTGEGVEELFHGIAERLAQSRPQGAGVELANSVPNTDRKQCWRGWGNHSE
jgi:GTPase SAR1 family protein